MRRTALGSTLALILSDNIPQFLSDEINIVKEKSSDDDSYPRYKFYLKNRTIDTDWFSPNELKILDMVIDIFKPYAGTETSDASHEKKGPWDIAKNKGMFSKIDFFSILDKLTPLDEETIKERFELQKELIANGWI